MAARVQLFQMKVAKGWDLQECGYSAGVNGCCSIKVSAQLEEL